MAEKYEPIDIGEGIKIGDISEMGTMVPVGRYRAKLTRLEAKMSKKEKPMLVAGYDVLDGPQEGAEITIYYTLIVMKNAKGRIIAPGIMEMKSTFAAVGKPLADDYVFPSDGQKAGILYNSIMNPTKLQSDVEIIVLEEQKKPGEEHARTRSKIVGLWKGGGASPQATLQSQGAQAPPADSIKLV